jgi:hypothetical protein
MGTIWNITLLLVSSEYKQSYKEIRRIKELKSLRKERFGIGTKVWYDP